MAFMQGVILSVFGNFSVFSQPVVFLNALCILLFTAYIAYQVWFHPLAKHPGPFVAKLTRLYSVYHAFKGDRHTDLYELHRKYGPVVRYGPYHVSISDVRAIDQIYNHNSNVQKSSYYTAFSSISVFNAIDKQVHGRKRRVMSHAFSSQAVRGMEPQILSAIRDWCRELGDGKTDGSWSSPKDMVRWSAYAIFDVLGEICFGNTFDTSRKEDNRFFLDLMALNVRIINICGQMPILGKLGLSLYLRRGTEADLKRQIGFSRSKLKARLAATGTTTRRDIIYYLQQAKDQEPGEGYSVSELTSEVILLLGAGSDTANTALTATFYFLAQNPEILSRLTSDVRSTFTDVESIASGPQLQGLTHLKACLDESMRLCPPVPMELPREVLKGGLQVIEHFFPEGTVVGVPIYTIHHSEEHFDQPFTYNPSRWLLKDGHSPREGSTADVLSQQRMAFMPFSVGPRACIGRTTALLELEVAIVRTLWLYDIRMAPGTESLGVGKGGEYKMKDNFIVGKEGPVLQFRKRQEAK